MRGGGVAAAAAAIAVGFAGWAGAADNGVGSGPQTAVGGGTMEAGSPVRGAGAAAGGGPVARRDIGGGDGGKRKAGAGGGAAPPPRPAASLPLAEIGLRVDREVAMIDALAEYLTTANKAAGAVDDALAARGIKVAGTGPAHGGASIGGVAPDDGGWVLAGIVEGSGGPALAAFREGGKLVPVGVGGKLGDGSVVQRVHGVCVTLKPLGGSAREECLETWRKGGGR